MIAILAKNWRLILIAALLAALGMQTVRISSLKQEAAEQRATDAESQRLAMKAQRDEETRRQTAIDKEAADAQTKITALEGDLSAARVAGDGLRAAATRAASSARARACVAGTSEAAPDAIGLFAELLGRLDERAGIYAEAADRSRIAGTACQGAYQALTK